MTEDTVDNDFAFKAQCKANGWSKQASLYVAKPARNDRQTDSNI